MTRDLRLSIGLKVTLLVIFTVSTLVASAYATPYRLLYSFNNKAKDGIYPYAGLILDASGNLYGTTYNGGAYGYGSVFEVKRKAPAGWTENVLYSFGTTSTDGRYPYGGLIFDASGNFYGTTTEGGNNQGTVFELTPIAGGGWTEKVLYSFATSPDGSEPYGSLIFDSSGNLYGTTASGGNSGGQGTVFELTPTTGGDWTETLLYLFGGNSTDGISPYAGLIFDSSGNLYGTTTQGGNNGDGTVFELTPVLGGGWTETVLYSFGGAPDGSYPDGGLIFDLSGNLYGTTETGGGGLRPSGTVFELTPTVAGEWTETILHSFGNNLVGGLLPYAGLILDASGNLYSTTAFGGGGNFHDYKGTVFKLMPAAGGGWTEKVLHIFYDSNSLTGDGLLPYAGLVSDSAGNLYGTTVYGGAYGYGAVFEIKP